MTRKVKHEPWQIRREVAAQPDGQRRWDRAYQLLLTWTTPQPIVATAPAGQEGDHECGGLRAGVESETGPGRDD
jgi:hypothetical protein